MGILGEVKMTHRVLVDKKAKFKVKVNFPCPSCCLNSMAAIEKQPPALFRAQGCRPCRTEQRAWCDFLPYKQCCLETIKIALAEGLRSWSTSTILSDTAPWNSPMQWPDGAPDPSREPRCVCVFQFTWVCSYSFPRDQTPLPQSSQC